MWNMSNQKTFHFHLKNQSKKTTDTPIQFKKITVPKKLRVQNDSLDYGGDIRIGDLTNNSQVDFIVYRGAEGDKNGATKPCFIGAFDMVAIHDIDNDGQTEVVCFFMKTIKMQILLVSKG